MVSIRGHGSHPCRAREGACEVVYLDGTVKSDPICFTTSVKLFRSPLGIMHVACIWPRRRRKVHSECVEGAPSAFKLGGKGSLAFVSRLPHLCLDNIALTLPQLRITP